MNRLKFIWEKLNSTFWFIPMMLVLTSILSAFLFIFLDYELKFEPDGILKYIFPGSADSARSILSTIAGAMIGVAGTVFSITLVALTLASSQFGSRLLRNFMYDTVNQVVLGSFVSTFIYCLLVLNSVRGSEQFEFIPVFSVSIAILFGIVNILLLIVFIHHIATSIQSDRIIADISESLSNNIDSLFDEENITDPIIHSPDMEFIKSRYERSTVFESQISGYVQYIDYSDMLEFAIDKKILIENYYRAGDYVVKDSALFNILHKEDLENELVEELYDFYSFGKVRTPLQDAEFAIHQMVEIAVRALSPGINDPYTAITCIDYLSAVMCRLAGTQFPHKYLYDKEGNMRLITDALCFEGMLDASYNQIRQNAANTPSVLIRMMEAMNKIMTFAKTNKQKEAIQRHSDMVFRLAQKTFDEPNDLKDIELRYKNGFF